MINFFNRLGRTTSAAKETDRIAPGEFRIIKSAKKILSALQQSKDNGTVVGIYSHALGEGMFLTGVSDISGDHEEKIVVLSPYDLGGNILSRTHFSVNEVDAVCPFRIAYRNPLIRNIDPN